MLEIPTGWLPIRGPSVRTAESAFENDSDWLLLSRPFTDPDCGPAIADDRCTPAPIVNAPPKMDTRPGSS